MKVTIALYGALREADDSGRITLDVPAGSDIAALRRALIDHLAGHAPQVSQSLVERSAFASPESILHDHRPVPGEGELAVLPPVSGG